MIRTAPFLLLFPALAVAGEVRFYPFWNLPAATAAEITIIVVLSLAIIAAIVLFEMVKTRREQRTADAVSDQRFLENARRFNFTAAESALLRTMMRHVKAGDSNDVFDSLFVFEIAVDGEVNEVLASTSDEAVHRELQDIIGSLRRKLHYSFVESNMQIGSTRNLSTGQSVWILGPRNSVVGEGMISRVEEFFFTVTMASSPDVRPPSFSSPVRLAFTRKTDGIYGMEVDMISSDSERRTLTCRHTLKFKRNQLRQDVRIETDLSISIRRIGSRSVKPGATLDTSSFMVKMTDLSGGGFAFVSEKEMLKGDAILVAAVSPKLMLSGVRAKIVAVSRLKNVDKFHCHAQFVNIEVEKKERVIRYVFTRMRELTQR